MGKKKIPKIQVTVQRENRLYAINKLANAIDTLARALWTSVQVNIENCHIDCTGADESIGISVDTADNIEKTEIKEL